MNRRKLLGLGGGAVAATVVLGVVAPPAQAFFPILLRALFGAAVRDSLRQEAADRRKVKAAKQGKRGKVRSTKLRKARRYRQL